MGQRRKWRELSPAQQRSIVVGGVLQVVLLAAALLDLRRRRPAEVNGPKPLWVALSFVNFLGPIAYFLVGRKHRGEPSAGEPG